jgi:hypothetical protein
VWLDYEDGYVRVNTTLEHQKGRNLHADPRVSLLIVDPTDSGRFLQIRGDADLTTEGALAHLDQVTRKYSRHPRFYGFIYPVERQARETRVICCIHPRRVTVDAIHA